MEVKGYRVRNIRGKWYAVVDYKDGNVRRQKSKALTACSEEEAGCMAMDLFYRCKAGLEPIKKNGALPLSEYAERYFKGRLDRHEYERSTYATNMKHVRAWARALGDRPLGKITERQVLDAIEGWFSDGRDATTVDKRITALNELFKFAVRDGACSTNPLENVRRPKKCLKELNGVNDSKALAEVSDGIRRLPLEWPKVAFSIAIYTGMRRGEVAALKWSDIDFAAGTIWVRRAIGTDDDGRYVKPPKSNKPRDIAMPEELARLLDAWRLECIYSHGISDDSYVVCDEMGRPLNPDCITHQFTALARFSGWKGAAGRRLTLHDLRHTTATALVSGGADIKTVQSVLGHSSAAITLDMYASADANAKKNAAGIIGAAL